MAQIAAEALGIKFEDLTVIGGDTDVVPFDIGAYASRTTHIAGKAVEKAADDLKRQVLELAAKRLERPVEQLDIQDSQIMADGVALLSMRELVGGAGGIPTSPLVSQVTHYSGVAYSFAAHFAEVEVDTETGPD